MNCSQLQTKPLWRGLQVIENMVARDGVEPPTPAFSGPSTDLAKWFGINGCD
jgi:hypothetical protein